MAICRRVSRRANGTSCCSRPMRQSGSPGCGPKGKDFDLDPSAHVDTGKWLEVKGTVQRDGTAVWIAAESIRLTTAPTEGPVEVAGPPLPAEPPPSVIFSAPLADDTDVPTRRPNPDPVLARHERQELSRSRAHSLRWHRSPPPAAPPNFTVTYNDGNRSHRDPVQGPAGAFQIVVIELTTGSPPSTASRCKPWTLKFTTGQ